MRSLRHRLMLSWAGDWTKVTEKGGHQHVQVDAARKDRTQVQHETICGHELDAEPFCGIHSHIRSASHR